MTVRAWTLAALMLAVVVGGVAGQEGATIRGRVAGQDGQPWAGARVTLHSAPLLWLRDLEPPDEVVVTADAEGRFTAPAATARRYGIWARAAAGRLVTDVAWARVGQQVALIEAGEQPMAVQVRLVGLQAWREHHPLVVRLIDATGAVRRLRRDREGRAFLTDLAGASCHLEFIDADGAELWRCLVPLTRREREAARAEREAGRRDAGCYAVARGVPDLVGEPLPPIDEEIVLVPPPVTARVRVFDGDGTPVAGARVSFAACTVVRPSTMTDAEGLATLVVPKPIDVWGRFAESAQVSFVVQAPDRAASVCGITRQRGLALEQVQVDRLDAEAIETQCRLTPGLTLSGRLETPVGAQPGRLALLCWLAGLNVGTTEIVWPDAEGRFVVHGLVGRPRLFLGLLLTDGVREALLPGGIPLAGNDVVDILPVDLPTDGDLGVLRLTALRTVDRTLERDAGKPAALVRVLVPSPHRTLFPEQLDAWCSADAWTDDAGRCRVVVPPTATDILALQADDYAISSTAAKSARVQLRSLATLRGTVVDAKDQPIAWARVNPIFRAGSNLANVSWGIVNYARLSTTADEDGKFTVRFVPVPELRFALVASSGRYTFEPVDVPSPDPGRPLRLQAAESGND